MDKTGNAPDTHETCMVGQGVSFERIRRITGYLVGRLERFNDANKKEVADRVIHACRR